MTNESSVLASIHDRICFKTNRSLALGLGAVAAMESFFKIIAYARGRALTPLTTFEWVALLVAFVFFVLISASARCTAERFVTILFALGVATDLVAGGAPTDWPELTGVIAQYPLWSTVIWISTALISFAAAVLNRREKDH